MTLTEIANSIRTHFETAKTDAENFLADHVPGIIDVASKIESDPLVQAAMSTVLPAGWKQIAADFISKLEGLATEAEAAKQAAAAEAAAAATAAAVAPPADPAAQVAS
jgi:hypothetical protein